MEVILDTNFIITCVKEKVDFFQAEKFGKLLIPKQVVFEIEDIFNSREGKHKENASLALKIIEQNHKLWKEIDLEDNYVDRGIKKYAENNKEIIVATLDKELRRKLKGKAKFLSIKGKKKISFI